MDQSKIKKLTRGPDVMVGLIHQIMIDGKARTAPEINRLLIKTGGPTNRTRVYPYLHAGPYEVVGELKPLGGGRPAFLFQQVGAN